MGHTQQWDRASCCQVSVLCHTLHWEMGGGDSTCPIQAVSEQPLLEPTSWLEICFHHLHSLGTDIPSLTHLCFHLPPSGTCRHFEKLIEEGCPQSPHPHAKPWISPWQTGGGQRVYPTSTAAHQQECSFAESEQHQVGHSLHRASDSSKRAEGGRAPHFPQD